MSKTRRAKHAGLSGAPAACRCEQKKFNQDGRRSVVWCKRHRCYVSHGTRDRKVVEFKSERI